MKTKRLQERQHFSQQLYSNKSYCFNCVYSNTQKFIKPLLLGTTKTLSFMQSLNSIHEYGATVFGSKELYLAWLRTPNVDLGGTKPNDLLYDVDGLEMVISLLYQIQIKKKVFKA